MDLLRWERWCGQDYDIMLAGYTGVHPALLWSAQPETVIQLAKHRKSVLLMCVTICFLT